MIPWSLHDIVTMIMLCACACARGVKSEISLDTRSKKSKIQYILITHLWFTFCRCVSTVSQSNKSPYVNAWIHFIHCDCNTVFHVFMCSILYNDACCVLYVRLYPVLSLRLLLSSAQMSLTMFSPYNINCYITSKNGFEDLLCRTLLVQ